ncbi:hypothetical protein MtrunA17_Chr2g0322411 [Medicago truncatula]|uniref:Transmembrane protein, putative n=1 Tax=Medicago truncatula TaxID=3880 RepID=A2Q4H1_MEDTR|nr:hypothetical protein MtrDRAFT_AC157488g4v2 [Medicago truncatula]AES67205.1 transmembrane protein, putative [Medicago truncatula]RHN75545.1 hypothetical protein MtrunA17_Chr2g0322411 [Medicago truncatula]
MVLEPKRVYYSEVKARLWWGWCLSLGFLAIPPVIKLEFRHGFFASFHRFFPAYLCIACGLGSLGLSVLSKSCKGDDLLFCNNSATCTACAWPI